MKTCSIAFLAFALIHGSKTHPRSQFLHNVLKHALLFPPVLFFTSIQPVRFSLFSRFISHQIVFSSQNKSAVSAFQPTYNIDNPSNCPYEGSRHKEMWSIRCTRSYHQLLICILWYQISSLINYKISKNWLSFPSYLTNQRQHPRQRTKKLIAPGDKDI